MELNFRTKYDRERIFSNPGDPIRYEYEMRYDDNGVEYEAEVGKIDLYEEIQSHALSVDINYILSKFANGDTSVLERRQGVYGDFSVMPSTYAEVLNMGIEAQNLFDSLPVDVKAKFDNSCSQWFASYGSAEWRSKMGLSDPVPSVDVKEAAADES